MKRPYFLIKKQMNKITTDRRDEEERKENRSFYDIEVEGGEGDEDTQDATDKEQ